MGKDEKESKEPLMQGKTIATKIPFSMYEEVNYLIESGAYLSISDFLRESMREHLKTVRVSKSRDIDFNEAKTEILSYFKEYQDCYLDEIALDLNIEFSMVSKVIDNLLAEKRIQLNNFSSLKSNIKFDSNYIKLYGKRLIVESKSIDKEYLKLKSINSINVKNKGFILDKGVAIISNHYSFIK